MYPPSFDQRQTPRLPRALTVLMLVLSGLYVWLIGNIPYVAIAHATYDDQLFVKLAAYILNGQWLGPYDETTLVKGPFLSLWIAADWVLNLPLLQSEALLHAAACLLLLAAVRPHFRRGWPIVPAFLFMLMNPMAWDPQLLRVMRDGLYAPLTLMIVALAAWAFGRPDSRRPVGWGLALGLAFGCFWITREEGVWLLPTVGVLWLGLWLRVPFGPAAMSLGPDWRSGLARLCLVSVAAFAGWAAIYGGLIALNRHVYGVANTVEFKQREFLEAYGALTRVLPEQSLRHVPVPAATLARIAAVSPSVAELVTALEPHRESWTGVGCDAHGIAPCDREWRAGWFMWALRDAAKIAGHYKTAAAARAFYRRLAEEVDLACLDGRLACGPQRAAIPPAFRRDDIRPTVQAFAAGTNRLVRFVQSSGIPASLGAPYYTSIFFDLVEGPHLPLGPTLILRALIRSAGPLESVGVGRAGEGRAETQIKPLTGVAPDAAGRRTSRVDLTTDCLQPDCRLFLTSAGGSTDLPLAEMIKGDAIERNGINIQLEFVRDTSLRPVLPTVERGRRVVQALQPVHRAYGAVMPALSGVALVLLAGQIAAAIRQRRIDFILLLQLALWGGIAGRLLLLSVLDATMFPAFNSLYLAPLFPMLLAAVALALWRGGEGIAGWARRILDQGWPGYRPAGDQPV